MSLDELTVKMATSFDVDRAGRDFRQSDSNSLPAFVFSPSDQVQSLGEIVHLAEVLLSRILTETDSAKKEELFALVENNKWVLEELFDHGLDFYLDLLSILCTKEGKKIAFATPSISHEKEIPFLFWQKKKICSILSSLFLTERIPEEFFVSFGEYFSRCDHNRTPFFFHRSDESSEQREEILRYHHLLCHLARVFGGLPLQEEQEEYNTHPFPFYLALKEKLSFYESLEINSFEERKIAPLIESSTPFAIYRQDEASIAGAIKGERSGLGAFHLNEVSLINFGPHQGNLDDFSHFGISSPLENSRLGETVEKQDEKGFLLEGWVRTHFQENTWLHLKTVAEQRELKIQFSFDEIVSGHVIFFFKAKEALIEDRGATLHAKGLEKHRGRALPVSFFAGGETMRIEPWQAGEMQLIPLSGGDEFWGADFYLSYDLSPKRSSYGWKVFF